MPNPLPIGSVLDIPGHGKFLVVGHDQDGKEQLKYVGSPTKPKVVKGWTPSLPVNPYRVGAAKRPRTASRGRTYSDPQTHVSKGLPRSAQKATRCGRLDRCDGSAPLLRHPRFLQRDSKPQAAGLRNRPPRQITRRARVAELRGEKCQVSTSQNWPRKSPGKSRGCRAVSAESLDFS